MDFLSARQGALENMMAELSKQLREDTLVGSNGEKRPDDPVAAAVVVGRIATGQFEDPHPETRRSGELIVTDESPSSN